MKNREVRENIKKKLEKLLPIKISKKTNKTTKKEREVSRNERKSRHEIKERNESYFASDEFSVEGLTNKSRKIWCRIIENETRIKELESKNKTVYDFAIIVISVLAGKIFGDFITMFLEYRQKSLQMAISPTAFILGSIIGAVIATMIIISIYCFILTPHYFEKKKRNKIIENIQMENIELEIRQEVIQEKIYSIIQSRLDYGHNYDKEV